MRLYVMVMILVMSVSFGAEVEFKTTAAKTAQKNYLKALKKAKDKYSADLKKAKSAAMKKENLEEALLIQKEMDSLFGDEPVDLKDIKTIKELICSNVWVHQDGEETKFTKDGKVVMKTSKFVGKWVATKDKFGINWSGKVDPLVRVSREEIVFTNPNGTKEYKYKKK